MTIRVLIVDDQTLIRSGLRSLIEPEADLDVVGEAGSGGEALALVRSMPVDVIVMDIRMPGMDGLEATRQLAADPALAGVRICILTTFELDENVFLALKAGASGFLGKGASPEELVSAIRTVARGEALLSPHATQALIRRYLAEPAPSPTAAEDAKILELLTERERQIVAMVAQGHSNDDIARELFLSPLTVKTHVNRAMMKLQTRDRAQLVVLAFRSGLAGPGTAFA